MTPATAWEAFANNLPATIAALSAFVISLATFYQSWQNGKKADKAAEKADVVAAETSEIKTNTDGNYTKQQHAIELLQQEIAALKEARQVAAVGAALNTPVPQKDGSA